ncbi:peptidase [Rhizobium ruizarguesonis]|nr:peptidase [Rhizobium ruizarguesonis]
MAGSGIVRFMKPFEIFRTGKHTSSQGVALTFADTDLSAIAAGYDPSVYEAPIVVGHPKQDAPAYGWIKSLSLRSGRLVAEPKDLDAAFSDLVKDGKFKARSAAFYSPDSPNNPTPGAYHLRHVGFLGAEPPAVKGLKAVEFSDADDMLVFADLEFADWRQVWMLENVTRLFRNLRDYFIETKDIATADKIVPQFSIDDLTQSVADLRAQNTIEQTGSAFSETKEPDMTQTQAANAADLAARLAEVEAREASLKTRETTFSETERQSRNATDAAFVDQIVRAGRLPIGLQATATALFSDLSDDALTFSEGGQETTTTPRTAFRELLEKLPVPVVTKELATGDGPDFSDPAYVAKAVTTEIREAAEKGETISASTAAMRLQSRT